MERNSLMAETIDKAGRKFSGLSADPNLCTFAVVVTGEDHERFGQIGQWVEACKGYGKEIEKVRFPDGQILIFPPTGELAYLDKTIFAKADSKLISEIVSGKEQVLLPCELVIESLRFYLRHKYVAEKPISAPSLPVLAHEFYCPKESCFKWFNLLSCDRQLEDGKLNRSMSDLFKNRILKEVLRGDL
jgi:hypothetical protein